MRKKNVMLCSLLFVLCLCCTLGFTGCGAPNARDLVVKINGVEVHVDDKVQDLLDQGLVICDAYDSVISEDEYPTLGAKELEMESYFIGAEVDGKVKCSNIAILPYNNSSKEVSLADCQIHTINFHTEKKNVVPLEINGVNPYEATPEEFLNAFDQSGITLYDDEEQKSKFIAGENYSNLSTYTGKATYKVTSGTYSVDVEDYLLDEKKRTVDEKAYDAACEKAKKTIHITEFSIEKKLDVEVEY